MIDRRAGSRYPVLYHARLYDVRTGELAGYLVEVSDRGLRVMTPRPLDTGANLPLQFHSPVPIDGHRTVFFRAQVRWCRRDPDLDFWAAGLFLMENAGMLKDAFTALEDYISEARRPGLLSGS